MQSIPSKKHLIVIITNLDLSALVEDTKISIVNQVSYFNGNTKLFVFCN